jgi:hypothetical protein
LSPAVKTIKGKNLNTSNSFKVNKNDNQSIAMQKVKNIEDIYKMMSDSTGIIETIILS